MDNNKLQTKSESIGSSNNTTPAVAWEKKLKMVDRITQSYEEAMQRGEPPIQVNKTSKGTLSAEDSQTSNISIPLEQLSVEKDEVLRLLRSFKLPLSEEKTNKLISLMKVRKYPAGAQILRQDVSNNKVLFLLKGKFGLYKDDDWFLNLKFAGDIAGEKALGNDPYSSASVVAEKIETVVLTADATEVKKDSELHIAIITAGLESKMVYTALIINELEKVIGELTGTRSELEASNTQLKSEIKRRKQLENTLKDTIETLEVTQTELKEKIEYLNQTKEELNVAKNAAEAANQAKSDFLASISHEIRSPMQAILGYSSLLKDRTELSSKQLHYVDTIESGGQHLLHLVNDLLDFSKIEAGKMDLELVDFDLEDLLHKVHQLLSIMAEEKNLTFIYEPPPQTLKFLNGDPNRLRQILLNLINNAIKFTEKGQVSIQVKSEEVIDDDIVLRFSITDTGPGISKENQEKIFEPFSQADKSIATQFGGTGLGLAITRNLVEIMNGKIWVESQVDQGSTFHFTARLRNAKTL
jgi:signal transduction histidine kinase